MLRTIAPKILHLVPVLFVVSLGTFLLLELVPGDPAIAFLGEEATPAEIEIVHLQLGLDKPLVDRYFIWLGDAVTGDLGTSLMFPQSTVTDLVQQAMPLTLQLAVMALTVSLLLAIPLAMWTAYREGTTVDRVSGAGAAVIISLPPFLAALILIYFFVFNPTLPKHLLLVAGLVGILALLVKSVQAGGKELRPERARRLVGALLLLLFTLWALNKWPTWPRIGFSRLTSGNGFGENLRHTFLPVFVLAMTEVAIFSRLLRTDLIATLSEDFILSARAKGIPIWRILMQDALRPSSFSLITLAGVGLGRLIGGTVIIETIFGIQGMGRMVAGNITTNDFPIVQGGVLVIATVYVLLNLFVDVAYSYLDPRIRRGSN